MNQEKFGKFIKELRKKHHLTQQQLADKYNVSFQAVSKWETGRNMPDNYILKKISEDFNISLEELYNGEFNTINKNQKIYIILCFFISIIIIINITLLLILNINKNDFQFKTLNTSNDNFSLSGSISYNKDKSAIYITNIKYNGIDDTDKYKNIKCILYESSNNIERKISTYEYDDIPIKLSTFLSNITFAIDDYESSFKNNKDINLYLSISATGNEKKTTIYTIPLEAKDNKT